MIAAITAPTTFQSALPRRERHNKSFRKQRYKNFNPRSREGSDPSKISFTSFTVISIRAPAKGATQASISSNVLHPNFNPRSREGSDWHELRKVCGSNEISIRAPAKGATVMNRKNLTKQIFQSALPRRERRKW